MSSKNNPFPGMNPFLQASWSDMHTRLIGYISDALSENLPPDLSARAEERVSLLETGDTKRIYQADVAVVEPWRAGLPPVVSFDPEGMDSAALALAEPLIFAGTGAAERWVEIHNAGGDLITVIEVLSPANKREPDARAYRERQRSFLAAGVQLLEIDLIRGGTHAVNVEPGLLQGKYPAGTCHVVCATRVLGREDVRWEVYLCPLRQPLPTVRVPLRYGEPDVALALQPLVDRCYRTGRYWLSAASVGALHPPAADAEEAAWVEGCLRDGAGLG